MASPCLQVGLHGIVMARWYAISFLRDGIPPDLRLSGSEGHSAPSPRPSHPLFLADVKLIMLAVANKMSGGKRWRAETAAVFEKKLS